MALNIENILLNEEEDSLSGKLPYSINVYGKEGENPHLHYKINGIEGCIRLDIPRYFCHETYHEGLPSREKKIIIMRYYRDNTQTEIAEALGVSQVQISRIENKIIESFKKQI